MSSIVVLSDEPKRLEFQIARKLGIDLIRVENTMLSVDELKETVRGRVVLLRVYSPYKLLVLSLICEKYARKVINSTRLILTSFNREALYKTLEEHGIETPRRYYIFDLCNVDDVVRRIGKTRALLLTFTKSEIEGLVETPQALVSLVEHRYYMSAEDVKINLVIPDIENMENILIIGREVTKMNDNVRKIIDIFGEGIYSITIVEQRGRQIPVSIDPVPLIEEDENINRVLEYIRNF
ncbi:MAG: hypothetical protein GXO23_01490 [Crenarchaeota archaeon]|nr:hypothetical protein [Thermoproteota archaeon]